MIEIKTKKIEELMRMETVKAVESDVNDFVVWSDVKSGLIYMRELNRKAKDDRGILNTYKDILVKLKWLCFEQITDAEALSLIENHFDLGINLDIDLIGKLKLRLMYLPYQELEEFKIKISKILEDCGLEITKSNLGFERNNESGSIKNWLKEYRLRVVNRPPDEITLAKAEFFNTNKNVVRIDDKDRERLKKLIDFYDFINTSVLLPGGYVEDVIVQWPDGEVSLVDDGNIKTVNIPLEEKKAVSLEVIPKPEEASPPTVLVQEPAAAQKAPTSPEALAAEIQQIYLGPPKLQKRITKEEDWLQKVAGSDNQKLRTEFYAAVQKKNVAKTIAAFYLLAELNELDKFLVQDEKLKRFLLSIWPKLYGPAVAAELKNNPGSWQTIKYFVKYILQQRLGVSASEAARVGAQLGNIFKKVGREELSKLAYFDLESRTFKWLE